MLHEKPNDSLHWKDKLDDLDHLPGEQIPDKNSGWQKLHNRLQEKPRNKISRWYWTAAACLLLIVGIPWLTMNEKDKNLVKNTRQQIPGNPLITQSPSRDNIMITPLETQIGSKRPNPAKAKIKQQYMPAYKAVRIEKAAVNQSTASTKSTPEVYYISINPDTIAFVTAAPIKKKLRVVHINELDKQVEHMQFAQSNASPVFQTKSLNNDAFSVFALSRNSSDNVLTIKLSPSN